MSSICLQSNLPSPQRKIGSTSYPCSRKWSVQSSISPNTEKRCCNSERVIRLGIFPMKTTRRSSCVYNGKWGAGRAKEEVTELRHKYSQLLLASHSPHKHTEAFDTGSFWKEYISRHHHFFIWTIREWLILTLPGSWKRPTSFSRVHETSGMVSYDFTEYDLPSRETCWTSSMLFCIKQKAGWRALLQNCYK